MALTKSISSDKMEVGQLDKCVFQGNTFKFLIGPNEASYNVHIEALRKVSKPLEAMMTNGKTKESNAKEARLAEVDEDTFVLFCQYAYTGAYRASGPYSNNVKERLLWPSSITCCYCSKNVSDEFRVPDKIFEGNAIYWCQYCDQETYDFYAEEEESAKLTSTSMDQFITMSYPVGNTSSADVERKLSNLEPPDKCTTLLCVHARLYVFADTYMIDNLKALCVHKLHRDLCGFQISEVTIHELVKLISYTFDNTSDDTHANPSKDSQIRCLISKYAAINADEVQKFECFRSLLEKGGQFVTGFTHFLINETNR